MVKAVPAWLTAVAVITVAAVPAAAVPTAGPGFSRARDLVVFARVRSFSELVTVPISGAPKHRVAQGAHGTTISSDSWSPDGRTIVFAFASNDGRGLLTVPGRGGAVRRLTWRASYYDEAPAWSPDGRWIAFVREVGPRSVAVFAGRPDGSGLHRISAYVQAIGGLSWSPDSRRLLVTVQLRGAGTNYGAICDRVEILRLGGSARLVHGGVCGGSAAWSPDGRRIAFIYNAARGTGRNALVVENSDGSGERVLVRRNASGPSWSPDGTRIAFSWYTRRAAGVTTIGADGRGLRVLTHDTDYSDAPKSWSPDGRWILFERQDAIEDFDSDVLLIHPDGTGAHVIARDVQYSSAVWRPRR